MKKGLSIFYFCLTLLGTAILFELILRFGGIMTPILTIDPNKGERYMPNKMCCSIFNYEGFGLAKTNSAGWFGNDPNRWDSSATSLAILGNSFIPARQVFYRHNFLAITEELFQNNNKNVRFYNFGKETTPLRESLYIKEEVDAAYHPDYFIVFINERSLGNEGRYIPYYELAGDSLKLNDSFKYSSFVKKYQKISLLNQSSLLFLIYRVKKNLSDFWKIVLDKFYPNYNKNIEEGVVNRPVDNVDAAVIKKFAQDKRVIFLFDLDSSKAQMVQSYISNSPVINVHPALMKMHKETGVDPYYWPITNQKGHWNYEAHRVIAREFSNEINSVIFTTSKK